LHRSARLCHCSLLSTGHLRDVHSFPTRRSSDLDWRADMQRGEKWYDNYTIEVVDQVGFDSFQADSGVLLAKTRDDETSPNIWIIDRKSTRLNSSHVSISYAVFCLKNRKSE